MTLAEYLQATGATARQIHYWSRVMPLCTHPLNSRDRKRVYDETTIPKVRLLLEVSDAMGSYFSVDTLKQVYDHYEEGMVCLSDRVTLSWDV